MLVKPLFLIGAVVAAATAVAATEQNQQQQQSAAASPSKRASSGGKGGGSGSPQTNAEPKGAEVKGDRELPGLPRKKRRGPYGTSASGFNANDVDIDIRITWCNDNTNFCQNVCLNKTWGAPINDGCEAKNLQWHCTCGNGKNPDPDIYTFPVMHYQCQYEVHQCQTNCATGDTRCTQECQGDRNCTAPKDPNAGKTAVRESDGDDGLDTAGSGRGTDHVNFYSAGADALQTGGYLAITAALAVSLHIFGF
ncbi:hypothetical protein GGI12_001048 [Dipsacomyces acuminosporus]|nr:hypothetical protein GGI12_001048 [Dipsacomyces acuminosporus]